MYKETGVDAPVVLSDKACTSTIIREGQSVKVLFSNGNIRLFKISANPNHAAPESGIISLESPLGHALMGKTVGTEVEYKVGDRILKVKIVGVE
jgi:transcription elongation GreA/GreB family factor